MRVVAFAVVLLTSSPVWAQQTALPDSAAQVITGLASTTDVAALVATLKAEHGVRPQVARPLLQLPPYTVSVEYRTGVANAAVHDKDAELFYVIDGAATLVTGGRLVNPTRPNADNQTGTGVEGGTAQRIGKGDFVLVPEGTPHWFSAIDSTLTLMSLHLSRAPQK